MIKALFNGFTSLFTSGFLTKPMGLLGFLLGICIMFKLGHNYDIKYIFSTADFYEILIAVSFFYTMLFDRTYVFGGSNIDWMATIGGIIINFLHLMIALGITCLFIFSFWMPSDE